MGMIAGAGSNLCYWEKVSNIKKLNYQEDSFSPDQACLPDYCYRAMF
jgi:hexokinase